MARVLALETDVTLTMPPGGETEARRFYGQILGMRETMRAPGERGVWFQVEERICKLRVDTSHTAEPDKPVATMRIDSAESMRAAVLRARYRTHDAPAIAGTRGFYANDPFGNRLELRQIK